MKKVNLEELALIAGVSKTTVSLILNGRAEQYRISPATRDRVLALAEAHQFTPDASAATLRSGRDRAIGVVIPDYRHFAAMSLLDALDPLARANGDQLLISCSDGDPAQELTALRQLLGRRVSALVVISVQHSPTALEFLPCGDVSLVVVGRSWPDSELRQLAIGATTAINTLISALLARRRPKQLLLLNGPADHPDAELRAQALAGALAPAGIPHHLAHCPERASSAAAALDLACEELGTIPEVVMASSVAQLEGALAFLTYHRNRWPPALTLACTEHHPLLPHLSLPCISLQPDWQQGGQSLLALLRQPAGSSAQLKVKLHSAG